MALLGVYPFTAFVANTFPPDLGIKLQVYHFHHRFYYDLSNQNGYILANIQSDIAHVQPLLITPGYKLGFPMYFGDETLEIRPEPTPIPIGDTRYFVIVGGKAEAKLLDSTGHPVDPVSQSNYTDNGYWQGGVWESPDKKGWKLMLRKHIFDPEEDNVLIGPDNPGDPSDIVR